MGSVFNSTGHKLKLPQIVAATGLYLTNSEGKRYMDLESGVWCTSVGHGNERVNQAIQSQLAEIAHAGFCYSAPIVEEAAQSILSICNQPDGSVVFLCSGSEGIDYARQAAKAITNRNLSMSFHDAYLGSFSSVLDRGSDWVTVDWQSCASCPGGTRSPDCDHLDDVSDEISEFIFEPGSSRGEVRFAPVPLVRKKVDRVRAKGGKIIVNEVTTGVGRTGSWFGFDHYGIDPDFIVLGKGLGNGYPVSAVVMKNETARELAACGFKYMQSHQNDPLGAAAAKEVIAVIEDEGLIDKAAQNGSLFHSALNELTRHESVTDIRGRGLMFAVDLVDESTTGTVFEALLDRGFIVGNRGASLRMDPPLIIERDEFLSFVQALDEILAKV